MTASNPANGDLVAGAASVFFPQRYGSVEVVNNDTANALYARTDGIAPDGGSPAAGDYEVLPGNRALVPNSAPMWWQGYGPGPNPGTTVKLSSASATSTASYEVIGR